jgi:hypothetical protein
MQTADTQLGFSTGRWVFTGANVCSEADLRDSRFLQTTQPRASPMINMSRFWLGVGNGEVMHSVLQDETRSLSRTAHIGLPSLRVVPWRFKSLSRRRSKMRNVNESEQTTNMLVCVNATDEHVNHEKKKPENGSLMNICTFAVDFTARLCPCSSRPRDIMLHRK